MSNDVNAPVVDKKLAVDKDMEAQIVAHLRKPGNTPLPDNVEISFYGNKSSPFRKLTTEEVKAAEVIAKRAADNPDNA